MMRDKLVSVIAKRHEEFWQVHARNPSAVELASAIIAALPDMIPDLEWFLIGGTCKQAAAFHHVYVIEKWGQRWAYWVPGHHEEDSPYNIVESEDQAKAAANEHLKLAIMAAHGLTS